MAAERKRYPLAWKIGLVLGTIYVAAQWYGSDAMHDYRPVKTEVDAAIAAIPRKANWQALTPSSNAEQNYTYDLVYARAPDPGEAESDAETIAGVVVKTLQQDGLNRLLESAPVAVYAQMPIDAPPGQPKVKDYGSATYDADHGDVAWELSAP